MANYRDAVLCKDGQKLLKMAVSGDAIINFTSVKTSSTVYSVDQLEGLTDIGEVKQSAGIAASTEDSPNTISLYAAFTNAKITEGYYVRNFGIYATDPADERGEKELLYAIVSADESEIPATFIPAYNKKGTSGVDFSCEIVVANSSDVTITLEENTDVPLSVFNNFVERFNSFMKEFNALKQKLPLKPESFEPSSVADRVMVTVKNGSNTEIKWSQILNNMIAEGTIELDRLASGNEISTMLGGYLPVYSQPDPPEGWQVDWLFKNGWYLGGIKKNCGGHPPVLNNNHTSWAVLVLNGMAMDESLNRNHRLQIAWDLVNSKCYMRRGWMSENTWADNWTDVGKIADGSIVTSMLSNLCVTENKIATGAVTTGKYANKSITMAKLSEELQTLLSSLLSYINSLKAEDNFEEIDIANRSDYSHHNLTAPGAYEFVGTAGAPNISIVPTVGGVFKLLNNSDDTLTIGDFELNPGFYVEVNVVQQNSSLVVQIVRWGKYPFCTFDRNTAIPSEERIAAIERQLNGISFAVDESSHLTYEKQTEVTT